MSTVQIDQVRTDGGTQMRAALNDDVVAEYASTIREGTDFPPVIVFHDGSKFWLADGFHRFHAYRAAGAIEIPADVRQGTKRDAVLFSVGANASHGLRRTNEDKRKAVQTLLKDEEWAKWSDRDIARRAGVSHPFVASLRAPEEKPTGNVSSDRTYTTKHGTEAVMDTAKIGKADQDAANDQAREEARAALPESIRAMGEARESAKERRDVEATPGLPPEDRIAELEAANASLTAENERLAAENKLYSEMKAEFEKGGFAEVIAGKDEVIRGQAARLESESAEKVKNLRSADFWKAEAVKLGWSNVEDVQLKKARAHA